MNGTTGVPDSSSSDRISKLERQAVRLRIGVLASLIFAVVALWQSNLLSGGAPAGACAGACSGKAMKGLVRLADKDGKIVAEIGARADGSAGLVLLDAKGSPRASLLLRADGPRLGLFGADMKGQVVLGVKPDGTPFVETLDAAGKPAKTGP